MPRAKEAREWAADGGLHGIGNSLYTPFSGPDGDAIDLGAYRTLVRYCTRDLGHPMLWLTSGIGEWWALTLAERKLLVEAAIDETRQVAPDTVIQVCTSSATAKDCLELTLHAQESGADICYLQTPPMEVHGGEGVLRFYQYIADRSDIALGVFDSPSSGYVLTPQEVATIYEKVPAVVAMKEGVCQPARAKAIHKLAPDLLVWECDALAYLSGWLKQGIVSQAQLGTAAYLFETPANRRFTDYWTMIFEGKVADASAYFAESGLADLQESLSNWSTNCLFRPGYFTHWGETYRYASSLTGLPVGDYPHSRPPQAILPQAARTQIREAYERAGLINTAGVSGSASRAPVAAE